MKSCFSLGGYGDKLVIKRSKVPALKELAFNSDIPG